MNNKSIIFLLSAVFTVLFFHACLTTGDRINMEEFKRQLEAGGQAMDVTQTAKVQAALEETAAEQPQETTPVAVAAVTQEPTAVPTKAPTKAPVVKAAAVVKTPAATVEKKAVVKTEVPVKKEEPAAPVSKSAAGDNKWMMVIMVFAAAFAVFALIAFIIAGKKREEESSESKSKGEEEPALDLKPVEVEPERAVEEYRETAALKPEPASQAPAPQPPVQEEPVLESPPEEKPPEPDNYVEPVSVDASPQPPPAVPLPVKQAQYGEGIAGISPTQFAAGSQGNAVHLLYKVGGDSPEFRTIKITVPEGWSRPSTLNTDEGYFTAAVNTGNLISTSAENMVMTITVQGLPAEKGEVAITFGERRGGSPGVKVQPQPGEAVFKIETEAEGTSELKEIIDSPVVDVN